MPACSNDDFSVIVTTDLDLLKDVTEHLKDIDCYVAARAIEGVVRRAEKLSRVLEGVYPEAWKDVQF